MSFAQVAKQQNKQQIKKYKKPMTKLQSTQGLNYPELPSRGILGNKEIILFDCMCELCGYEWVWLLDELMSVCSVSDNFYTFF